MAGSTETPYIDIESRDHLESLVLEGDGPVIIDFWAPWCGPCKAMAPAFEAAAREVGEGVLFAKINTDQLPELRDLFGVRSIPTLVAMSGDAIVDIRVGASTQAQVVKLAQRARDRFDGVGLLGKLKRLFG